MTHHQYRHIDEAGVTVKITMRELVENIVDMNYGVHRFLSHLVDIRTERLNGRIKAYNDRGDDDVAGIARLRGDPLIEAIKKLLDAGEY